MGSILQPGYLRWDGFKYVLDPTVEIVGPAGPPGASGPSGPQGPSGVGTVAVQNQSITLSDSPFATLNFTGSGVTASNGVGGTAIITILGGGSSVDWAGDLLSSTNSAQYISSISGPSGTGGTVTVNTDNLNFSATLTNISITQSNTAASGNPTGANFSIIGQTASTVTAGDTGTGGTIFITGGSGTNTNASDTEDGQGVGGNVTITAGTGTVSSTSDIATGGNLVLCSGAGVGPGEAVSAGSIFLQSNGVNGNIEVTINPGQVTISSLDGHGSGFVAVDNSGDLSWSDSLPVSQIAPGISAQILLSNATPVTTWTTMSGDATMGATGALTLASVNSDTGTFGSASAVAQLTVNGKGLVTAASNVSITTVTGITISGTPSSGQVLTATSSSAADWQTPAVQGGWITALDLDLTAQGNQTFSTDGNYTIDSLTFAKINSSNEVSHAELISGVGLTFTPTSSTNYDGSTRTLPALTLTLSQVISNIEFGTPIRIWCYISSINATAEYDAGVLALEGTGTIAQAYAFKKGINGSNQNGWVTAFFLGSDVFNLSDDNINSGNSGDNVLVITLSAGYPNSSMVSSSGAYSSGWPSASSLNSHVAGNSGGAAVTPQGTASDIGMLIGAMRDGSGTSLSVTFARIRVDYRVT
jgi:hypothetical protein